MAWVARSRRYLSFNTSSTSVTTCELKQITSAHCFGFFMCKLGIMLLLLLPRGLAHSCRNSCSALSSERRSPGHLKAVADPGDPVECAREIYVHVEFCSSPGSCVERLSPRAQHASFLYIPIQWLNRRNGMGQIHPCWDSNDISHLYRSFLNEVNWVLRGPSLATCIFNCSKNCSSEGSFACLRIISESGRHKLSHWPVLHSQAYLV